ncbi:arpin-like [Asterias amurensis]|uniref:arpin-like n=1 Tax=Asterias amurensis TaxID=7602 RepID=UPI003AB516F6
MSRVYDNKPLQSIPVENHTWAGCWNPARDNLLNKVPGGPGVLMDGILMGRSRHVITDSEKQKFRYVVLQVKPSVAHKRKFDKTSGVEIEPNFSDNKKVNTGHLMSSYKTEAKGVSDKLTTSSVRDLINRPELIKLTSKHDKAECIALWAEEQQLDSIELENGDTVRLKTVTDSPFIFSLAKLDTVTSQVSNYAGGENVGASWTDKVMSMKSHDSTQPADDGAGADEDEWDD